MNNRNTAGRLGFIKDSEGVYRKGNFIFKDNKIIRESNIVPEGTIKDLEDSFVTMDECIRKVLAYPASIGEEPRATNVYIDKVGNNYKPMKKLSKNTVAIVTSDRNVYEIKAKDIPEQTDTKDLENKDKEDKPVDPKEIKDFSKPTEFNKLTESAKQLNEAIEQKYEKSNEDYNRFLRDVKQYTGSYDYLFSGKVNTEWSGDPIRVDYFYYNRPYVGGGYNLVVNVLTPMGTSGDYVQEAIDNGFEKNSKTKLSNKEIKEKILEIVSSL